VLESRYEKRISEAAADARNMCRHIIGGNRGISGLLEMQRPVRTANWPQGSQSAAGLVIRWQTYIRNFERRLKCKCASLATLTCRLLA